MDMAVIASEQQHDSASISLDIETAPRTDKADAMHFEFATAPRIIFGPGTLKQAGSLAQKMGRCALVVTGTRPARVEPLLEDLRRQGLDLQVYPVSGEPDVEMIQNGAACGRTGGCDHIISIGGGSVIDAGKAIAAMITNGGDVLDYLEIIGEGRTLAVPPAPFMAIPTTAGTGAEVTHNAVIASPRHRVKVSLRHTALAARVVITDPELTYDLPPHITAATGMDALTQLLEAFVCTRANPLTDGICRQGLTRAGRSLVRAFHQGRDAGAREDMAVAGLFGGLALANSGLGAVHGIAGPLGGMFAAPHGAVCAALLPHVVRGNLRALCERAPQDDVIDRYVEALHLLTLGQDPLLENHHQLSTQRREPWDLPHLLQSLVSELDLPSLGAYGVREKDLPELAEKAARASSMKANRPYA